METKTQSQNDYEYIESVRNTFIDYGRYLQRNDICDYGDIDDYENFLIFKEAQEKEFEVEDYYDNIPQKDKELMDFNDFLKKSMDWENELIIVTQEAWDYFYENIKSEEDMDISAYVQANEFYDKFAEITGVEIQDFDKCFVSSKYIDEWTYNTINLIVNVNGTNQKFIIDRV